MNDLASHLVERVIPEVPVRQWVCSLPFRLRYLCGYDRNLCAGVLGAFVGELCRSVVWRAKHALSLASVADAETGTITFMQRFDSGLRLNVHLHVLALDGVYVRDAASGALVFHALPAPSQDDVALVARRTAERVDKLLARHGRSLDPEKDAGDDPLDQEPALSSCASAAARGVDLVGERAGRPTLRLLDPSAPVGASPSLKSSASTSTPPAPLPRATGSGSSSFAVISAGRRSLNNASSSATATASATR
jgi:hypothetical protein